MPDTWSVWQSEVERLSPFADEWKEGRVEDFIRNLLNCASNKRKQRDALLTLMEEVRNLHVAYKRLLAFFDLENACRSWSPENCGADEVERVLAALAEWRGQLLKHSASFPPAETETLTFAGMQARMQEAQAAAATIGPCFEVLDAALSSGRPDAGAEEKTETTAVEETPEPEPAASESEPEEPALRILRAEDQPGQ
jgi:hypothetical protein